MNRSAEPASPALGPAYARAYPPPPLTDRQRAVRTAILSSDDARDYETLGCPCGAPGPDTLVSEIDRYGLPARNVVCQVCGLVRLTPRWRQDRYLRFYQTEYRPLYDSSALSRSEYATWVAGSPAARDRTAWILDVWRRRSGSGPARIVEIGAGGGWNLAGLPREWERVGYDVDDAYLQVGREVFGLQMRHGLIEDALPDLATADIVLLSHVVEHLPDPSGSLRAIGRSIRAAALVLIEVPGIFRIHRTNLDPRSYLQNAHTFTFCAATLRDVCERAGLEVLEADETAQAVCRQGSTQHVPSPHPGLAEGIVRYLRRCDRGFRQYRWLRGVPAIGRFLAYGWKQAWFGTIGGVSRLRGREGNPSREATRS